MYSTGSGQGVEPGCCEDDNEPSRYTEGVVFLSYYRLLKWDRPILRRLIYLIIFQTVGNESINSGYDVYNLCRHTHYFENLCEFFHFCCFLDVIYDTIILIQD